jgi:hypothetical protein
MRNAPPNTGEYPEGMKAAMFVRASRRMSATGSLMACRISLCSS